MKIDWWALFFGMLTGLIGILIYVFVAQISPILYHSEELTGEWYCTTLEHDQLLGNSICGITTNYSNTYGGTYEIGGRWINQYWLYDPTETTTIYYFINNSNNNYR